MFMANIVLGLYITSGKTHLNPKKDISLSTIIGFLLVISVRPIFNAPPMSEAQIILVAMIGGIPNPNVNMGVISIKKGERKKAMKMRNIK
jgi:hypothetical protein